MKECKKVIEEFPRLFRGSKDCYFEDGWGNIVRNVLKRISELTSPDMDDENYPSVLQVKEKFGGLRLYASNTTEEMENEIGKAEKESCVTCESCGKEGEIKSVRGWYKCLCEKCEIERYENG